VPRWSVRPGIRDGGCGTDYRPDSGRHHRRRQSRRPRLFQRGSRPSDGAEAAVGRRAARTSNAKGVADAAAIAANSRGNGPVRVETGASAVAGTIGLVRENSNCGIRRAIATP